MYGNVPLRDYRVNSLFTNDIRNFKNAISAQADTLNNDFWNSLSPEQKAVLIEQYRSDEIKDLRNMGGFGWGRNYTYDVDRLLSDLQELSNLPASFDLEKPTYEGIRKDITSELRPAYDTARANALDSFNAEDAAITAALASLDTEAAQMQGLYADQLQDSASYFNRQASNVLNNQYLANAQTYGALQSDMQKSRQSALEAGADAGVRIASNINALLTAQNKQSATSLETSNALAEMLLQQRNAAAGLRSEYGGYMSDVNRQKASYGIDRANNRTRYNDRLTDLDSSYRSEVESLTDSRYNARMQDYYDEESRFNNQYDRAYESGNLLAPTALKYATNRS
jgi:hypothetical protein